MLEYFKASSLHLTNKKLGHRAWLAYCLIELYAGPARLMKDVIPRLRQHLDLDEPIVCKLIKELETGLGIYRTEAENREKPVSPWMARPFDGKTIQLLPTPDQNWVKVYNWLPLAKALEIWERRLLAYLLVPSRQYPRSQNRRQLSLQGINDNCRIPGKTQPQRKKTVRIAVNRFRELGLIAGLGEMGFGLAGWVEFPFHHFDEMAKEMGQAPGSGLPAKERGTQTQESEETQDESVRSPGSDASLPRDMQKPEGIAGSSKTPSTRRGHEEERVAAFWKAIQALPRYEPRRGGIEAEPRIIKENLLEFLHPQATPEDLKAGWKAKDLTGLKFVCQQLVSSSICFRARLVEAINRTVEARLKRKAEDQRLQAEGPREIFEFAWEGIQGSGRGFHPDNEDGVALLARILILGYPEVRPSVQVVEHFHELRDGSRWPSKYWIVKPPELPEAEKTKVFEKWLAALHDNEFHPLPRPLFAKLQEQKYETEKEKARRLREEDIRAQIGKEPLDGVLQELLEEMRRPENKGEHRDF